MAEPSPWIWFCAVMDAASLDIISMNDEHNIYHLYHRSSDKVKIIIIVSSPKM